VEEEPKEAEPKAKEPTETEVKGLGTDPKYKNDTN
jgi:hypothetical protein